MKNFICPLCQHPLIMNSQGVSCCHRHQFDRAREGYFNLLPAQHKHSREPGDAKTQLHARSSFLQAGFFNPLLEGLQDLLPDTTKNLLDIGCGEGFFTGHFAQRFGSEADIYGIDIAKEGVRLASKRYSGYYAVASSYALPIADSSMDVITRIYAPSKDEELQRVLSKNGRIIIVTPGQTHLSGLRQSLYKELRPHPEPEAPSGFIEHQRIKINFALNVTAGKMTEALLQMTPYAWRLAREQMQEIAINGVQDLADFNLNVYQRA